MDPLFCENCVKYLIDNSYPKLQKEIRTQSDSFVNRLRDLQLKWSL